MGKLYFKTAVVQIFLAATSVWAGEQIGTLTQAEGVVKIFSHPSKTLQKESGKTYVFFESEYFIVNDAKVGDHVEKGNIVQTAPGAKARVVYENGDQFHVGPGTAYRISWDKDASNSKTQVNLAYGKLRGIIEKGGPRSQLKIKTRSAVMGVRGTDFFIAQGGADQGTEVSIMRGSVEVAPVPPETPKNADHKEAKKEAPPVKPIQIAAGQTAEIGSPPENTADKKGAVNPQVELRQITQEDLKGIQKSSTFSAASSEAISNPELKKTVESLEKKATATVLKDIQKTDKDLYAALQKNPEKLASVEDINQASLQKIMKTAPPAPEKRKPYKSELEDLGNGAYEKYFKTVD